jgi:hypothetical protein
MAKSKGLFHTHTHTHTHTHIYIYICVCEIKLSLKLMHDNITLSLAVLIFFFFNQHYNPSWVLACSTVVEHSQQDGFTESCCQRHIKPPTWRRTRDLERSNFHLKRPAASEATLANPAAEGGTMGEKWPIILPKWQLPRQFWVLLHAVKHNMGQTALLPLRRKACWGLFHPKNPTASAGFEPTNLGTKGQHATSRPPKPRVNIKKVNIYIYIYIYCF